MSTLTLRASNGQYVCAEMGGDAIGTVNANRDKVGPWETFTIYPQPDGRMALQTINGRFFCAEGGGGDALHANRLAIGPWEHFTVVPGEGGGIALKTDNGHFVCAENGGGGTVVANRTRVGPWETFNLLAPPDPSTVVKVTAAGHYFVTETGTPWRYKGVSAFQLLDRYVKGEDLTPFLSSYNGYNTLRVWPYVPVKDWGSRAWNTPPLDTILRFIGDMNAKGWYVEYTLLTDSDSGRIGSAKDQIHALRDAHFTGLFLEAANEPEVQHDGIPIDTGALRADLEGSGYQFASGNYTDGAARWYGTYLTTHTQRDSEWPRRCHDGYDYWVKPDDAPPGAKAVHAPCLFDEPAKLQDVGGNKPLDWRAYFGGCALFGGGATFHSETGKYAQMPTAEERQLAAEALVGMNAFPADASSGAYRRITENSLRTYIIGNYSVRIRPTTPNHPESGWTPIDGDGILWRR